MLVAIAPLLATPALLALSAAAFAHTTAVVAPTSAQQEESAADRYLRMEDDGEVVRLEAAIKTLVPADGNGPEIALVSAIHIGEPGFYAELQHVLEGCDLVLFESVKPPGTGRMADYSTEIDDAARRRITEGRMRFLASAMAEHFRRHGAYPTSIDELAGALPLDLVALVDVAYADGWDFPIELVVASTAREGKFDLVSRGADGRAGGEGLDADLFFSDQPPLTDAERERSGGLQKDIAIALGLVFQLDEMDHSGARWENCDLAMDQIEERLGVSPANAQVFDVVRGESMLSKLASGALELVSATTSGSAALQLVGIELLARADRFLADAGPAAMGDFMRVVIEDRNAVVARRLGELVDEEVAARANGGGGLERIGVIYGAAHMLDLERRLGSELGYEVVDTRWTPAVELELDDLGISRFKLGIVRRGVRRALDFALGD